MAYTIRTIFRGQGGDIVWEIMMADLFLRHSGQIDPTMTVKYKDCVTHYALCTYQEALESFYENVSLGVMPGLSTMDKFGRNPDIDTGTDPEDLWDGGGIWAAPSTACKHNVASTDSNDNATGTGAQTMQIFGLDADHSEQTEIVSLDGTNNVPTEYLHIMIYRKIVRSAGSNGANIGTLTATSQADGTVTAQIAPGNNKTLMAIYQIPGDKIGLLSQYYVDINESSGPGRVSFDLLIKPINEVWQVNHHRGGDTRIPHKFTYPRPILPKSLVKLGNLIVTNNNSDVSGGFEILLVDI